MIRRTLIVVALLLLPLTATAQSEFGIFISTSQFEDGEIQDGGDIFDVEFEEDMGYGVLYNLFWGGRFSTELAYQKLGADLSVSLGEIVDNTGELDLDMLSATGQFHFLRAAPVSPYVGAGVAYVSGETGSIDASELGSVDLEDDLNWLVNAGLNFGFRKFAIFLDGKYVMYEARGKDDAEGDGIDVNPLILSGGIKFRF